MTSRTGVVSSTGFVAVALTAYWLASVPAFAQAPLTERVVRPLGAEDGSLFVYPGLSQSHFRFIVVMLARSVRVPVGLEQVAEETQKHDDNLARVSDEDKTTLVGLTIRQALDALVAADPRYSWREEDGVFVIRPVAAWRDATHFLHETIGPVSVKTQRGIGAVETLYAQKGLSVKWSAGGWLGESPQTTRDLNIPISVTLPSANMLDVLNAIAKSHGQLSWVVEYSRAPAEFRHSCVVLVTFDGRFVGIGPTDCAGF